MTISGFNLNFFSCLDVDQISLNFWGKKVVASSYIRRHILRRPPTQIITTRELLPYGTRSAVDQTTYRMVHSGFLIRLARGVFVRSLAGKPTLKQIAEAKMAAFGKILLTYGDDLLRQFNIPFNYSGFDTEFAINGHSSSFWARDGLIVLKGIGPRKVKLCQTKVGRAAYALWHIGDGRCGANDVWLATRNFGRTERAEFRRAGDLMPAWLNYECLFRYPEPSVA